MQEPHGQPKTTFPFPVGDENFVADRLQGVADIITADLRKVARLPDKLKNLVRPGRGPSGLGATCQTLPPRVVHLLSWPKSCGGGLHGAVRHPCTLPLHNAEQLEVARLPVSAGGLTS